jgi:23S rRNA (uracil1939-C5)-methyltransferase
MSRDETFEIELTAMAHGGKALGRHNNKTIFIPYTIPGERVQARIRQDKGRIAFAEGTKLIEASGDRVFPRCPHFGPNKCGRCHWQHIDYAAQLLIKQDIMNDQLSRIGGFDDAMIERVVQPVIASPQEWYYNYHMTMLVSQNGELGFPAEDGGAPFLIEECHIIHPDLLDLFHQIDMDVSGLSKVRLQIDTDGNHMLIMSVRDEESIPELETDLPTSVNLILPDNEPVNLIGDSHSYYEVAGKRFRVTAGSEFRSNVSQLQNLAEIMVAMLDLKGGETVLDLYAGVGFFSAFIADRAGLVTLVESYPPAATDADVNLAQFENVDVIEGSVEDVLPELDQTYQAVILDPPSEGLSVEVVDLLARIKFPTLIYISGDPATLARDAKRLTGYQLTMVQPIDLSPQTYFIDSICKFVALPS